LTLVGVGETKPVITGLAPASYIVKVNGADDVVIDNLEINGGGSVEGANGFDYGILVNNSGTSVNPVEIGISTIKNIWKNGSNGVGVEGGSYVLIHHNNISSFHKRGIRFINSDGKVYSNEIIGDNVDGTSRVQNLVNLWGGSTVEIYGNTLHNALTVGGTPTWDSPGIFVTSYGGDGASHANIHGNEIYNGDTGVVVGSTYADTDMSTADITNNNLHDLNWAINFEKSTVSATITKNKFSNNNKAVNDDVNGTHVAPSGVTAEKNWWGSTSGPAAGAVFAGLDYDPWYLDEEMQHLSSDVSKAIIYVDDDYTAGNTGAGKYFGFNAFTTIQEGITAVNVGGTVNVAAGIYDENVIIDKANLTLHSETALGAIIKPATTASGWPSGVVLITADGVTVDGFEIDGTTVSKNGINAYGVSNVIIKNNKVHGAVNAWDGVGIMVWDWDAAKTVNNATIENNTVYDTGRMGIMVMDYGADNKYDVTEGHVITGNTVYDVWEKATAWGDGGGGIQINVGKNSSITNNEVYNVQDGQRGIYMFGSAAGNTITGNTLRNNPIGIKLWISGAQTTPYINWGSETPTSPQVHNNKIYDNVSGAENRNETGFLPVMVMDATHNWWGNATGPTHADNPTGTGDAVSNNVNFRPWCIDEACTTLGYDIPLYEGWNLISLPLIPTDSDIETVLSDVLDNDNVDIVWSYENGKWLTYKPSIAETLTTMEDGKGYWVYMNAPDSLIVKGTETPPVSAGETPPSEPRRMYTFLTDNDWNLIGFKSVSEMKAGDYIDQYTFKTLKDNSLLWYYLNSSNSYSDPLDKNANLKSGYGYWLLLK